MNKPSKDSSLLDGPAADALTDDVEPSGSPDREPRSTPCYPVVAERAEWSKTITLYDRQHFLTYARLLDAERDEVEWRDGVREILRQDPEADPRQAKICWESHLERARWIATVGFQEAVERARGQ